MKICLILRAPIFKFETFYSFLEENMNNYNCVKSNRKRSFCTLFFFFYSRPSQFLYTQVNISNSHVKIQENNNSYLTSTLTQVIMLLNVFQLNREKSKRFSIQFQTSLSFKLSVELFSTQLVKNFLQLEPLLACFLYGNYLSSQITVSIWQTTGPMRKAHNEKKKESRKQLHLAESHYNLFTVLCILFTTVNIIILHFVS